MNLHIKVEEDILSVFEKFKNNDYYKNHEMNIDLITESIEFIENNILENQKLCNENCNREINISYLYIAFFTHLTFGIYGHEKSILPLPIDWLEQDLDPNFVLSSMLLQITNHSIGITKLIEHGLHYSANPLLRSLLELCWITIVIINDKEKMNEYFKTGRDNKESINVWYKHFRPEKLKKEVNDIEKELLSQLDNSFLKDLRKNDYKIFSHYTHNSFVTSIISYHVTEDLETGKLSINLHGRYAPVSHNTFSSLNSILFYNSILIMHLLVQVHKIKIEDTNDLWKDIFVLHECCTESYSSYLYDEENENED